MTLQSRKTRNFSPKKLGLLAEFLPFSSKGSLMTPHLPRPKKNGSFLRGVSCAALFRCVVACFFIVIAGSNSFGAEANWVGTIRCEIDVTGPGYSHQETQTWTLAGTPPTQQGASKIHAAKWAVTGQGRSDRTNASQSRRIASWTASVSDRNAPVSFLVTPTGQLVVQVWHAQLTAQGGYTGTDQFIQNGVTQPPQRLVATLYEWPFQKIEGKPTDTQLTGTSRSEVRAFVGPLQDGQAKVTINFAWALGLGTAPPLPPSALPPQPSLTATSSSAAGAVSANTGHAPFPADAIEGRRDGGAIISGPPIQQAPPRDPSNFYAIQTGDGRVELRWDAVPGVSKYLVLGPRLPNGRQVTGTATTITGLPAGTHEWALTSWYEPDGSRTVADKWPRTSARVTSSSGTYRVTVTRVKFHHEEPDNRFKEHGKNNEIFISEHSQVIDRRNGAKIEYDTLNNSQGLLMVHHSPIHGDTNSGLRIKAGSVSSTGGIQTGDEIAIWDADRNAHHVPFSVYPGQGGVSSHPSPGTFIPADYRPFVCWEGKLNDGVELVLIRPVVWLSVRSGNSLDGFLFPYRSRISGESSRDFLAIPQIVDAANVVGLTLLDTKIPQLVTTGPWRVDQDRPIGLEVIGDFNGAPANWTDTVVILTREKIESFLAGQPSKEHAVRIRGTMKGQNAVQMGEVSLFLKIERLAEAPLPIREDWVPPPITSGTKSRYRVTGTRVQMHREEYDPGFKEHGKNNEIAVSKHALVIDRRTNAKVAFDPEIAVSPVHGDINGANMGPRIRAGTVSSDGGIQTGDNVQIWTTASDPTALAPIPNSDWIPFVFWEGDLNDGAEAVLIRPMVWLIHLNLWGGHHDGQFLRPYKVRLANEQWTDFLVIPPIRDVLAQPGVSLANVPQLVTIGDWNMDVNRPFGVSVTGKPSTFFPLRFATLTDRVVVLTREKIETSLGGRRDISFEVRFQGAMDGSDAVPMGDCSLFLKIEKME